LVVLKKVFWLKKVWSGYLFFWGLAVGSVVVPGMILGVAAVLWLSQKWVIFVTNLGNICYKILGVVCGVVGVCVDIFW
jgi:4-hydroxybenzoate polyprenyltransferase